jgi:hypothetical protein
LRRSFFVSISNATNVIVADIYAPRMAKAELWRGAARVRGAVLPEKLDNGRSFVFGGLGRFDTLSM